MFKEENMKKLKPVSNALLASAMFLSLGASAQAAETQKGEQASNACGLVSVYKMPPETKRIYQAAINTIDGVPVSSVNHTFQLTPGKHKIRVIENITDSYFTRRRGEMLNYKVIEIEVEANKKYYLGAKYNRKHKSKLKTGEYWDPIVWKTRDADCEI